MSDPLASRSPSERPPITVAVNLLWCLPGAVGGSEQYLVRQLCGLAARPNEFSATLYCTPSFVDAHPRLAGDYATVTSELVGRSRLRRIFVEHTWLARRTRGVDVVHHGGGTAPLIGRRPIVLTIHDLQYATRPDYFSSTKLRYLRSVVPRSASRAAIVAVPSEYVRSTVVDRLGKDPERVVVVPHGVEATIGAGADEAEIRRRHGLGDGRIVVFPAVTHPHKGHALLLDLLDDHWSDPDLRLVLIGGVGAEEDHLRRRIERSGSLRRVVRLGRVPDADRDGLIKLADALVFPSEYEGFGAPVVEAMALGTPVICSDQPALVEVVAGAGVIRPREVEAWADALEEVDRRRTELVAAGRRRAAEFTLEASGAALARAYRLADQIGR